MVVSRLDHDANVRPWVQVAEQRGATVRWAEFDPATGELPVDQYADLIGPRTRLVAVTAASNAIGTVPTSRRSPTWRTPPGPWSTSTACTPPRTCRSTSAALGADFYVTSAYKWSGPHLAAVRRRAGHLGAAAPGQADALARHGARTGSSSARSASSCWPASPPPSTTWPALDAAATGDRRARLLASMAAARGVRDRPAREAVTGSPGLDGTVLPGAGPSRCPTVSFRVDGADAGRHRHRARRRRGSASSPATTTRTSTSPPTGPARHRRRGPGQHLPLQHRRRGGPAAARGQQAVDRPSRASAAPWPTNSQVARRHADQTPVTRRPLQSGAVRVTALIGVCVLAGMPLVGLNGSGAVLFALLGSTTLALVAASTCSVAARRAHGRSRAGWALLATACLSWGLGNAYWSLNELLVHADVLFPSPADVGFLIFPVAGGAGLWLISGRSSLGSRLTAVLDGLIVRSRCSSSPGRSRCARSGRPARTACSPSWCRSPTRSATWSWPRWRSCWSRARAGAPVRSPRC